MRKIGRMLDDIKCEILKNRSVIIDGIKEIKQMENVNTKITESIQTKKRNDYF